MTMDIAKRNETAPVPAGPIARIPTVTPHYVVYENQDELLLVSELPGVRGEELQVQMDRGELRISATRGAPTGVSFIGGAPFERRFAVNVSLSSIVDTERISAELGQGVLRVHLPKTEAAKPKRIPVRTS